MKIITCIAIDDEPLLLELLADYIGKLPGLQLQGTYTDIAAAIQTVKSGGIDLVFLDIQMPGMNGIQVMELLNPHTHFILTTAYPDYALDSYAFKVLDYLVKPISFNRFCRAVNKAEDMLPGSNSNEVQLISEAGQQPYFFVKSSHKLVRVNLQEIDYIESKRDYVSIVCGQQKILTLQNLASLEAKLSPLGFVRVHRSYLVALSRINSIDKESLHIGTQAIPISATYREAFLKRVGSL